MGDQPQLVIGGLDAPEETQLFNVDGATRLEDGRLAVGVSGTHEAPPTGERSFVIPVGARKRACFGAEGARYRAANDLPTR